MSVADATPDLEQVDRQDRAFLGHPKGLGFLGFTEACERFSYYSMQTLLVLYMVNYLLLPGRMEHVVGLNWLQMHVYHGISGQPLASAIFGTYTALVYGTPVIGGIIADKWLGRNRTLILGGILMAIGHFLMAVQPAFLLALLALLLGVGAFKGNIATQVGALYGPNDLRRAMAFQIFYIFINVSVIVAPLISGTLGQKVGWHYGFGCAGVVMVLGLIIYLAGRRYLPSEELRTPSEARELREPLSRDDWTCVLYLVILIPVLAVSLLTNQEIFNAYLIWGDQHFDLRLAQQHQQLADHRGCDGQFYDARRGRRFLEVVEFQSPRTRRDQQDDHRQRVYGRGRPVPVHGRVHSARGRQNQPVLADDVRTDEQHRLCSCPAGQSGAFLEDFSKADHVDCNRPLLSLVLSRERGRRLGRWTLLQLADHDLLAHPCRQRSFRPDRFCDLQAGHRQTHGEHAPGPSCCARLKTDFNVLFSCRVRVCRPSSLNAGLKSP